MASTIHMSITKHISSNIRRVFINIWIESCSSKHMSHVITRFFALTFFFAANCLTTFEKSNLYSFIRIFEAANSENSNARGVCAVDDQSFHQLIIQYWNIVRDLGSMLISIDCFHHAVNMTSMNEIAMHSKHCT